MALLLVGCIIVAAAALLSGIVGFSYALVALPLLLIVGVPLPEAVLTNLVIGLLTRVSVLVQYRRQINVSRVGLLVTGCVPGIVAGLILSDHVPGVALQFAAASW